MNPNPPDQPIRKRFFSAKQLADFKNMIPSQMDRFEFKELCGQLAEALILLENATRIVNAANSPFTDENRGVHIAQTQTGSWEYTVDGHEGKVGGFVTRREGYRDAQGQIAKVDLETALRTTMMQFNAIREERDELKDKLQKVIAPAAPMELVRTLEAVDEPPHRTFQPIIKTEPVHEIRDGVSTNIGYAFHAYYRVQGYGHEITGVGQTPAAAVKAFDEAWNTLTLLNPTEPKA